MSQLSIARPRELRVAKAGAALAVLLCIVAIGFPSLYYPFGRDQAIHAYIAKLVGDSYVIYRDVFNVKPPLTTVIHWLALVLFGDNMRAIRIMDMILMSATALMLHGLITSRLRSAWLGGTAAVAFASFYYSNNYWFTAQTDGWCGFFMTASILLYDRSLHARSARIRTVILCAVGVMAGLSFWLKYTSAVVLLVFPILHRVRRLAWPRVLGDGAAVSAGFLSCVGLGIAALAAMGALPAFFDIQDFMRSYVGHGAEWWEFPLSPLLVLAGAKFATALAMLGIYATYKGLSLSERRADAIGLLLWLAAGWSSGLLQGKAFLYHLLPLYPPLAIAAAVGLHALIAALRRWRPHWTKAPIAAAACALIVLLSYVPIHYRALAPVLSGKQALRDYWDSDLFADSAFRTRDNLALVDYLKNRTSPCDSLFIWGYEPSVYFLSGRPMVSRFLYDFPMSAAFYRQSYRNELLDALAQEKPAVFVIEHDDRTPQVSVHDHDSAEVFAQFGALKQFVAANYRQRDRVGHFDVYFRRDIDPSAARRCHGPAAERQGQGR